MAKETSNSASSPEATEQFSASHIRNLLEWWKMFEVISKWTSANLPSELTDLSASVWAANAFVRSNNNSWNCFDSAVVSTDRRVLKCNENRILTIRKS